MKQAAIIDDRPDWVKREDLMQPCLDKPCYRIFQCQSRFGKECKVLGGTKIPKLRLGAKNGF